MKMPRSRDMICAGSGFSTAVKIPQSIRFIAVKGKEVKYSMMPFSLNCCRSMWASRLKIEAMGLAQEYMNIYKIRERIIPLSMDRWIYFFRAWQASVL